MKKFINLIISLSFVLPTFFMLLPNVNADTITAKTTDALYVRTGKGTSYSSVALLSKGTYIALVNSTRTNASSSCTTGWYQINYNNSTDRYVCGDYVSIVTANTAYYTTSSIEARTSAGTTYTRASASMSAKAIDGLIFGTDVEIISESKAGSGCDDKWYYVNYYGNKKGYLCSSYVYKYADITATDTEYNKVLQELGFPESYWPYLTYLHKKHPTWIFKPVKTNINFTAAISGEEGKNKLQTSQDAYRTSSKPSEGTTWYTASNGVIAFYLDPRNFLVERTIFMFENLGYDKETQTADVVKSIFGNSYLSSDDYVKYFMEAAQLHNVSPIHLATRVKQEGGTNESYGPVSGTRTETYNKCAVKGYYNYYNIGASSDWIQGLYYAAGKNCDSSSNNSNGRPWTTRELAIKGGAQFLSENYIAKGQYTLYFQKFNTSPTATHAKYTHQYMTNILAPAAESVQTFYAIEEGKLLETAYTFSIPVYNNTLANHTSLPTIGNTNNELSSITIDNVALSDFDSDVITYTHYVSNSTTKINIKVTPSASTSTVTGVGEFELTKENTSFNIMVASQSGIIKTYTLNIIKVDDSNKTLTEILNTVDVKINSTYLSGIKSGTIASTLIQNIKKNSPSTTVTIKNSSDQVKTTEALATTDTITIKTANDEEKTYTIVIKGDLSGDGKITILDLLKVQKHILKASILNGAYKEAADTNYDNSITILDLLRVQKHILGAITLK